MASQNWVGISDNVSKVAHTKQGLTKRHPCWSYNPFAITDNTSQGQQGNIRRD